MLHCKINVAMQHKDPYVDYTANGGERIRTPRGAGPVERMWRERMSEINVNGAKETEKSAEAATDAFKKVEDGASELFGGLDIAVPEGFRAIAEQTVNQSREAYENAKGTMEQAIEALEQSIDHAGQGAAALNRKAIDLTQTNLNTGFDLAKDLAGAKNVAEIMELQASFMRKQFGALAAQAEEVRTLTSKVAEDTATPIKDHVSRSVSKVVSA